MLSREDGGDVVTGALGVNDGALAVGIRSWSCPPGVSSPISFKGNRSHSGALACGSVSPSSGSGGAEGAGGAEPSSKGGADGSLGPKSGVSKSSNVYE